MVRKRTRACGPVFARVACTHHVDALRRALVGNPSLRSRSQVEASRTGSHGAGSDPRRGPSRGPRARPRRPGDHPRPAAERPRVVPADRRLARRLRGDRACALRAPLRPEHPPGHGCDQPWARLRVAGDGRRPNDGPAGERRGRARAPGGGRLRGRHHRPLRPPRRGRLRRPPRTARRDEQDQVAAKVVSTETFLYLELWKQLYDWGAGDGLEQDAE